MIKLSIKIDRRRSHCGNGGSVPSMEWDGGGREPGHLSRVGEAGCAE